MKLIPQYSQKTFPVKHIADPVIRIRRYSCAIKFSIHIIQAWQDPAWISKTCVFVCTLCVYMDASLNSEFTSYSPAWISETCLFVCTLCMDMYSFVYIMYACTRAIEFSLHIIQSWQTPLGLAKPVYSIRVCEICINCVYI